MLLSQNEWYLAYYKQRRGRRLEKIEFIYFTSEIRDYLDLFGTALKTCKNDQRLYVCMYVRAQTKICNGGV